MSPIKILSNIALSGAGTGNGATSTVGEPSVGWSGQQVFVTGNWYASQSTGGGAAWTFVDPNTFLPAAGKGFCCDQTVMYAPSQTMMVWLLQYSEQGGTNVLRVAVNVGPALGGNVWHWWDFQPDQVDATWTNQWFDFNHAALSDNFLYIASNVYRAPQSSQSPWVRAVVLRLPLAQLRAGGNLSYDYFDTTTDGSPRCTQGATSVMYFASNDSSQSQIRLFSWPENSTAVGTQDIPVSPWNTGPYLSQTPSGVNWLSRCDDRMTGGWVGRGRIGFMWSANALTAAGTTGPNARPNPYVRVVRLDEVTKQVVDEPDIWSSSVAYSYPDAATNDQGDAGISLFRGGGASHPGHVVGALNAAAAPAKWVLRGTANGSHSDARWGDYVTCRRHDPDARGWVAAGYTLHGAALTDVRPRVVRFEMVPPPGGAAPTPHAIA
ncbi:MAG TPA: hypothetical protein VKA84_06615 [Gemmatimonadaceae bacterium]|nr:hypothetical protein [Gemmatimonadaceae bacterium]